MTALIELIKKHGARSKPVALDTISNLERELGFVLAPEYRNFLAECGFIVYGAHEVYGLGLPDDYYLNVRNAYADLSSDPNYPRHAVPLMEEGDGHYYLFDNEAHTVLLWAAPNAGIVRTVPEELEAFIAKQVFD